MELPGHQLRLNPPSTTFQHRQAVLAHFNQRHFRIGIMRPLAVVRVMPEGDGPVLRISRKIGS